MLLTGEQLHTTMASSSIQSGLTNLAVTVIVALGAWFFLATQRAARLRAQLDELLDLIEAPDETTVERIWKTTEERIAEWKTALDNIRDDTDKVHDRLIRLNAATERRLATLLDVAHQVDTTALAKLLNGEISGPIDTGAERATTSVRALRKSISFRSYLEWPWRSCPPRPKTNPKYKP